MKLKNIDTSTTEGKIEVMQAAAAGEKIACSPRHSNNWNCLVNPAWNWAELKYDVVEKPREIWINFYEDDANEVHFSKESADRCALPGRVGSAVKFVEVAE